MLRWLTIAVPLALALSVLLAAPRTANAAGSVEPASEWAQTDHGGVRLISSQNAVGRDDIVLLGLQFRMLPGWHIYWRSPGDAGFPPRADWSASENLASAEIEWPAPQRFSVLDLQTVGYSGAVILPVTAHLAKPGEPLHLRARIDYLTCSDICVPYTADLALDLPAGTPAPSMFAHDLARARAAVPGPPGPTFTIDRVSIDSAAAPSVLAVDVHADPPLEQPDVFIEAASPLSLDAPMVSHGANGATTFRLPINAAQQSDPLLVGLAVTVTIVDGARAIETTQTIAVEGSRSTSPPGEKDLAARHLSPGDAGPSTLALMLALGILGGLVLNLMPCVLPVLSIKLLSIVGYGGDERRTVRAGFVASACGILFSFMVLAVALAALKASGAAIGWGLQFQQPWFLTAMVLIVTAFAGNLWGVFEVPLPRAVAAADGRAGRIRGMAGHFLTGALATLLATPCSAPFLGTAIGFALAGGTREIFVVFTAIATGLALPYLTIAAFPGLATRLPRPGRWMARLRRVLAVALAGTAVWLIVLLSGRIGWPAALAVGGIAVAVLPLLGASRHHAHRLRPFRLAGAAVLAAAAFAVPARVPIGSDAAGSRPVAGAPAPAVNWVPFEPERIPGLVAEGRIVFVNVTADWCLTCKLNERLVLSRDPVRASLALGRVVAMQADWTAPDDRIARYLAGFGRYGIPFDAVYGPAAPEGLALPELLSDSAVEEALARAEGGIAQR
ncbi:MAG: thioredoxin family protein [Rhodospirillales bacterium]|nr:thioredoxin family protein [Rhodospirillales bacterium]